MQVGASKGQLRVTRNWNSREKKEISSWTDTGSDGLSDSDGAMETLCNKVNQHD